VESGAASAYGVLVTALQKKVGLAFKEIFSFIERHRYPSVKNKLFADRYLMFSAQMFAPPSMYSWVRRA
jgi:hypothetical protein